MATKSTHIFMVFFLFLMVTAVLLLELDAGPAIDLGNIIRIHILAIQ